MNYWVFKMDKDSNYVEVAAVDKLDDLANIPIGAHSSYRITNERGLVAEFSTHVTFSRQTDPYTKCQVREILMSIDDDKGGVGVNESIR